MWIDGGGFDFVGQSRGSEALKLCSPEIPKSRNLNPAAPTSKCTRISRVGAKVGVAVGTIRGCPRQDVEVKRAMDGLERAPNCSHRRPGRPQTQALTPPRPPPNAGTNATAAAPKRRHRPPSIRNRRRTQILRVQLRRIRFMRLVKFVHLPIRLRPDLRNMEQRIPLIRQR